MEYSLTERATLLGMPFPMRREWSLTALGIEGIVTWDPGPARWRMPADAALDTLADIQSLPEVTQ